jgi:hypothetical protein
VSEVTPHDRAISSFATPSEAIDSALAWIATRRGCIVDAAILANSVRCSALTGNAGAAKFGIP